MNVEIGPEAALFPEKEYIYGIFVAVYLPFHIAVVEDGDHLRGKSLAEGTAKKGPL
jgi:hypothetical protein